MQIEKQMIRGIKTGAIHVFYIRDVSKKFIEQNRRYEVLSKISYEDIFKIADIALYESKNKGRGQTAVYNERK